MMPMERAQIVRSLAGRDKGSLFCVLDAEGDFVWLADGKNRRVESPKRKRKKHAAVVGGCSHPALDRLRAGEPLGNQELRRAIAALRDEMEV